MQVEPRLSLAHVSCLGSISKGEGSMKASCRAEMRCLLSLSDHIKLQQPRPPPPPTTTKGSPGQHQINLSIPQEVTLHEH